VSALVETASSYRFYFAVYVRNVGRLTPLYMALTDPFRRLVVAPGETRPPTEQLVLERADRIITTGCDVEGVPRVDDDWGLPDPMGQPPERVHESAIWSARKLETWLKSCCFCKRLF
jgi:hypothetical protein